MVRTCCGVDQDGATPSSPGQLAEPVTEGPGYGTRAVGTGFWAVDDSGAGWDPVRPDKWDWRDGDLLRSLGPESPALQSLASTKEDRGADEMIMRIARCSKWVCLMSCSWMPGSLGGQLFGEFPGARPQWFRLLLESRALRSFFLLAPQQPLPASGTVMAGQRQGTD
ncbi:hypothetical protein MKX08_009422 [Trichoderma sp. CBMAI-0020]|nr:hypothetical protein MKX08_009422 [Trichoderma sp. CBMAI-0020]